MHYAHTSPRPDEPWQPLETHLRDVSGAAAERASAFGGADWAALAGLWHDLGKYSEAFQEYLAAADSADPHEADSLARTDHSTAGAQHAVAAFGPLGHLLAFAIAGHHAGLPNADDSTGSNMRRRLLKPVEDWSAAPPSVSEHPIPPIPEFVRFRMARPSERGSAFAVALFMRMIFSALVDADFIDTEAFMSPERGAERTQWPADMIDRMLAALERRIEGFGVPETPVARQRARVAAACREEAERQPGIFTLTVPTGGGKTLASLLFGLRHARANGLRRVIYVAPFTSIIEQNAAVYRDIMRELVESGFPDPVVEHHSNLDPDRESASSRRASENWDAPLVVTTAVQFYESLFAHRGSRCRKLHNLAKSVVILDEAQSLPVELLDPCLRAIEALNRDYGTSVVLCTATQPAVAKSGEFPIGLDLDHRAEIAPDVPGLFDAMRRVEVRFEGHMSDELVADRMLAERQVLAIVNTRKHAHFLADALGNEDGHFHLSALMCPAHRSSVLEKIRKRLERGRICRVVSTQLIEAGVDVDFPLVLRALAGLDSIAQAAGRCNRNGRLPRGETIVFETDHASTERFIAHQVSSARQILALHDDLLSPEAVEHYFRVHYWSRKTAWDKHGVLEQFHLESRGDPPFVFQFREASSRFRMIESTGVPVIIPWSGEGERLCQQLRDAFLGPTRQLLRKLQRYTVQIPERTWLRHGRTAFELVHGEYPVLALPKSHYSPHFGLMLDADVGADLIA